MNAYLRAAQKHPKLKQQAADRLNKRPDRPRPQKGDASVDKGSGPRGR